MGKSSSDEGKKAAKAGLCACGICCALCIGIPLLIIIIVIIIIVVAVGSAADSVSSLCDDGACDYGSSSGSSSSYDHLTSDPSHRCYEMSAMECEVLEELCADNPSLSVC